ncbi:MAG: glutathione peroxidase, partial [Devosia sp.]
TDFTVTQLDGTPKSFADFAGKLVLVVNVASKCGLTPQYEGLEALWQAHKDAGLVILGFPCNQFAGQEPGSSAEIAEFCQLNYGVSFPLMAKVDVNGEGQSPLYAWLKTNYPGDIDWNFAKFLIGRDGQVAARFASSVLPAELEAPIAKLL